jgi:hypothetical protein
MMGLTLAKFDYAEYNCLAVGDSYGWALQPIG